MGKPTPSMLSDANRALRVIAELMARPKFRCDGIRVIGTESASEIQEALRGAGYKIRATPPRPSRRDSRTGIYLAARYSRAAELRAYRSSLDPWVRGYVAVDQRRSGSVHQVRRRTLRRPASLAKIWRTSTRCEILIAFTQKPRTVLTCGGRHFEAGYAHSRGAQILLVGPRENIFYQLADGYFETWEACLASLDQSARRNRRRKSGYPEAARNRDSRGAGAQLAM
jgi:hypothetical protein